MQEIVGSRVHLPVNLLTFTNVWLCRPFRGVMHSFYCAEICCCGICCDLLAVYSSIESSVCVLRDDMLCDGIVSKCVSEPHIVA